MRTINYNINHLKSIAYGLSKDNRRNKNEVHCRRD